MVVDEPIKSCAETSFGCCSDGVTAALGPANAGCPGQTPHTVSPTFLPRDALRASDSVHSRGPNCICLSHAVQLCRRQARVGLTQF